MRQVTMQPRLIRLRGRLVDREKILLTELC
jgi:hypothetical protein